MKRYLFVSLILLIVFFGLCGCSNNIDEEDMLENVTMTIKDGTLTNTGATVIITDLSGDDNIYGEFFRIDKKENNKWKELEVVVEGNYGFHMVGYSVNEDNILVMDVNWEWLYGKLSTGEYRLVKDAAVTENNSYKGDKYVYVEFTIE